MKLPDDPFIVELLPEFIDTWIEEFENNLPKIYETKDLHELYRFGHTIKGSCLQFGFDDIAQLGIELMSYSKEENWEKAQELTPRIFADFIKMKDLVEKELNK